MSAPIRSEVVSESDSPIRLELGASSAQRWTEIAIRVYDADNNPVSTATGMITVQAVKSGTDKPEPFTDDIDLSSDSWSWKPELSTVTAFIFSIVGLNANYSIQFTINNWSN